MKEFLILVENEEDVGINEITRVEVETNIGCNPEYKYRVTFNGMIVKEVFAKKPKAKHEDETANSAPRGKSLEERVKSLENAVLDNLLDEAQIENNRRLVCEMYENQPLANQFFTEKIEEFTSKFKELEEAFESECDHHDAELETLKENIAKLQMKLHYTNGELSELQQAFVKYAMCAKPDPFEKANEEFDTYVKNLRALHDMRDIATRHVNELCKQLPDQKDINKGKCTQLMREIENERNTIDHCNGKLAKLRKEHIDPGQLLCRNDDGTVKPAGVNEVPVGIATQPIVHPIKQFRCTDCAHCCRIYIKTTHETTPTYCPYGGKVNWQEYTETIPPSGSTEQADCSKEEKGNDEIKQKLCFYKNRLVNLQQLTTKTIFHNSEIDHIKTIIEATEKFLNKNSMKYRLVCNNCSQKCVLHFDNHELPMAVPDCPWKRNTKEWELQCKLSDGLWRRTAWNPET